MFLHYLLTLLFRLVYLAEVKCPYKKTRVILWKAPVCRHSLYPEDPFPCSYTWSHLPWRKKGVRMKGWEEEEEEVGSDCYLLTNTKGRNTKQPLLCTYPIVLNNQQMLWSLNGSDFDFFFFFVLVWLNDLYLGCTGHLDVKTKKIRWSIQESSVAVKLRFNVRRCFHLPLRYK